MPLAGPPAPPSRLGTSIALGTTLAVRGPLVKAALVFAALLALIGATVALAHPGSTGTLVSLPSAVSSVLAWSAGVGVAFAASVHAFRRDHALGVRALLRARGARGADYAAGRVVGLGFVLFAVVGGGSLVSDLAVMLVAGTRDASGRAGQDVMASLVFALGFAVVMAPLALAAIGGRSRAGGYLGLVALLAVPELLQPWTAPLVPSEWRDLVSVPSALTSLRTSLVSPEIDAARLARAACIVVAVAAFCFVLTRVEIARIDAAGDDR